MGYPRLDSRLEAATDAIWSVTRNAAFVDVILRSAEGFLTNTPQAPGFCKNGVAELCTPRRDSATDLYAGFAVYTAAVMALGCISRTQHILMRKPDELTEKALGWTGRAPKPSRRGTLSLPVDELGWAANSIRAAVVCAGHALVTYKTNETVQNSHGLRLATGCLAGAGFVLAYTGVRSSLIQLLPNRMSLGRATSEPKNGFMSAITDFKMWCILHVGASFIYSGIATAAASSQADPWRYRYWGSPLLALAGVVDLMAGAVLFATTIKMHGKVVDARAPQASNLPKPSTAQGVLIEELDPIDSLPV